MHNLMHLSDDAFHYETIDKFSAFHFESKLGFIKKNFRQPNLSLQQVINKIAKKEAKGHKPFQQRKQIVPNFKETSL